MGEGVGRGGNARTCEKVAAGKDELAFKPRRLRASASTVVPIVPCSAVRRPKRTSDRAARAMKRRLDGGRPALRTGGRPARGRAVQLAAPPAGCACAPCCRRSVAAGAPGERRPLVCCHVAAPRRRLSDAARLHQPAAPQLEQAQRRRQCCGACGRAAGSSRPRWATRSTLPPPIASDGAQRAVRAAGGGVSRVRFCAGPEHVWALSRGVLRGIWFWRESAVRRKTRVSVFLYLLPERAG